MKGLTVSLYTFFEKHRLIFWLVLSACLILLTVLALRVSFKEEISKMVPSDTKTLDYHGLKEFGNLNCYLAGASVIGVEQVRQIKHDATINLVVMCLSLLFLGTALFSLIFLPHLIGNRASIRKPAKKWLENAGRLQPDQSRALRWTVICLTPVFFYFSKLVEFDTDFICMPHNNFLSSGLASAIYANFNFIAIMTAVLVFGALLLFYGRIELAITGFLPMAVSWLWILGIMGMFHLRFNGLNIIPAAFIFGIGIHYCIFMLDGLVQGYARKTEPLPVIRMSIFLSGLITLIGFGVLLFAKHPDLHSIALIAVIGIVSVVLTSQVLEPFLFRIFVTGPVAHDFAPVSFSTLIKSVFAYSYFITGCILLSISGFILLGINPFFRKKAQRLFNNMISKFALSQIYIMVNVTKIIVHDETPDFSKPCVYVANHQSVLDILCMIMMSPKIILLTNKWVWNSPLFGFVVRYAGYYPIFEGAEPGIDILKSKIAEGYSIAIFPEGTRSKAGKIGRFHKGAFYLAHKLELDLVPVLFHRTCHCIAKGSFIVRDATFTVKILPRIKFSDPAHGTSYQQLTKSVHNLFIKEYAAMEEKARTPERCRKRVIENFMFKGFTAELTMRVMLQREKNFRLQKEILAKAGSIMSHC